MKKTIIKALSVMLAVVLTLTAVPLSVFASTCDVNGHTPGSEVTENYTEERYDESIPCNIRQTYDVVRYCTVCNLELSRESVENYTDDHQYGDFVRETTDEGCCLIRYCERCIWTDSISAPNGCEFKKYITPTVGDNDGYTDYICTYCGYGYTVFSVDPWETGDIVHFGLYPQSRVTDSSLISTLNSKTKTWTYYDYYIGTGDGVPGEAKLSDYMKYTDITYNGEKYRGVHFTTYRSWCTEYRWNYTCQYENGYNPDTVYWFRYEPIEWRVLDADEGYLMCENIIDNQAYYDVIYYDSVTKEYYKDSSFTSYANDFESSTIRDWLNDDFYQTAFNDDEQALIQISNNDKISLLSYDDAKNSEYGFSSDPQEEDSSRVAQGTDYAKCQGLSYQQDASDPFYGDCCGNSEWWLSSSSGNSMADIGRLDGGVNSWSRVNLLKGIRPVLKLNPKSEIPNPDTEEDKYIGIVTTEHSLTVGVKEKFKIAFNMIENGKLVDEWKKMSVVVSNPSIISLSDYKETDHGFMLEVTGKEPGVTNVVVTDTETGINTTFEIGVYDEYGQTRTYDMKNMPLFTKGFSKIPTSIYNMNGLYINNFDYKEDGEYYNVTFDVYNKQCGFGAVDIFDENGVWVGCEKIEPNKQIESMWDWLEESYYLITDVATGKFIEYTSEFFSKKTEIDIKVPKGGYFNITNNADTSRGVQIYLFCEIFTKAVGKILPALGVEATEDQFMRDIVGAIVAEAYQDAALEAACSTLTKETIKIFTKFTLSNVIDTSVEMVNIFENFLNALDISWKHIAKMTVSGAESVLSKTFTSIGTPLKAGFTASEITNWYEIYESTKYSMDKTYASIYTDMDNIQNIDGIEVITNGKIDVDTALQVFKIYNNKSAEANANGEKYELYNISFVKNDKTVQPSGLVEVRIPIPKGMKKDTCEIHRQEKDGSWTILTARVEGNYLVFETDHFSLYMITGDMYSLNIQSLPDKLTYTQGEVFDSTGLVLELNGEYITEGLVASPSVMETVGTQKVQIHYGAQFVEIDVEVIAPEPEYNYSFYIQEPSRTEIRNKDTIVLHAIIDGNVPEGSYIEWDMSEGNFSLGWDSDTDVYATAEDKGWDTITAILYDADGNELARDSIEMYSKSGFFDKIGGFFRSLFGTTMIYEN